MFKTGKTKVPLDKAARVGRELSLDPREFWIKCFKEYMPGVYDELERHVLGQPILSNTELRFIKAARFKKLKLNDFLAREAEGHSHRATDLE